MTEQRVVIDAQIIAARVFSKEVTKDMKVSENYASELRALRVLRGEMDYSHRAAKTLRFMLQRTHKISPIRPIRRSIDQN